tara:strand:- start:80 stop:283 length:204 start_codon:yes stop_codon:yes gene_type:complete
VKVEVRNNNVEAAIRIMKKKLQQDGFFNELRKKECFVSKGQKRRQAKAAAIRRARKEDKKRRNELGI